MEALTEFEVRVAVRRLVATQPQLRALAPLVDREALWRVCRDELQGRDVRVDRSNSSAARR